jgi:hypothetical protein
MNEDTYKLSFTTGGLFQRECRLLAGLYLEDRSWDRVRKRALDQNVLQFRTAATGRRVIRELVFRLRGLPDALVQRIAEGGDQDQKILLWSAICMQYRLIDEFAREVLVDRYMTLKTNLPLREFDAFLHAKSVHAPELEALKESTVRKLRQVLFRMLREAEFLDQKGMIHPVQLNPDLAEFLSESFPDSFQVLPLAGGMVSNGRT